MATQYGYCCNNDDEDVADDRDGDGEEDEKDVVKKNLPLLLLCFPTAALKQTHMMMKIRNMMRETLRVRLLDSIIILDPAHNF